MTEEHFNDPHCSGCQGLLSFLLRTRNGEKLTIL